MNLRVVIIDDDALVAGVLKDIVTHCGAEVVGVAHGYETGAVLLADRSTCDLAFIDLRLGEDLSGVDLARQAVERGIQVIAVTGSHVLPEGLLGAALLTKPFSVEAVRMVLGTVGVPHGAPGSAARRGTGGAAPCD
jgi:DNA-binding response OmpR family regulator